MASTNGAARLSGSLESRLRETAQGYDFTTLLGGVRMDDAVRSKERSYLLGEHIGLINTKPATLPADRKNEKKSPFWTAVMASAMVALVISLAVSLGSARFGRFAAFASDGRSNSVVAS